MAKKIRPRIGYNVVEYLDAMPGHIERDLKKPDLKIDRIKISGYSKDELVSIINTFKDEIKFRVNEDICGSSQQLEVLREEIESLILSGRYKEICVREFIEQIMIIFNSIANFANSFRLECSNCLSTSCKMRDPDFPVEEIQARAEGMQD